MRNKPVIGIVSRPNVLENKKLVLGVYENYIKKVILNGGIPFIIVNPQILDYKSDLKKEMTEDEKSELESILKNCDGIIMPGGEDGYCYDYFITKYAIENNMPILGICLGMQLIGEYFNGSLTNVSDHYLTNHQVVLKDNSYLKNIYKSSGICVNSRHHFQILGLNDEYISAYFDHVIEGIEDDTKLFCIGVQWHPEDLENSDLFQEFIKICSKYKQKAIHK